MTIRLTDGQLLRLRARSQGLGADSDASFLEVVQRAVGLQAQDATAGVLSARARTSGLLATDIERARLDERSVVRTWVMRGTLHFVAASDLGWLLPLLGPPFVERDRSRLAQLGLDEAAVKTGVEAIRALLADEGPSSRERVRAALAKRGVASAGQATVHLLYVAALQGLICCSADRGGGTHEFALLDDWIARGETLPRPAALEELARRYLAASAPATVEDFATWSGLPARDARAGWEAIADERMALDAPAGAVWMLQSQSQLLDGDTADQPIVRLLPRFDTYLLTYRSRDLALPPEHARRVFPGGAILNTTVLVDGRLAGVWQLKRAARRLEVTVEPFEPLPADVLAAVEAEARDIGRFWGVTASTSFRDTAIGRLN